MAVLIVSRANPEDIGKTFSLDKDLSVVGRRNSQSRPDIELDDEFVSRRHIEILFKDGKYWIKDLESTNGTMLNDDRILTGELYELKHNCRIGLGLEDTHAHVVMVFKESEDTSIIHKKEKQEQHPVKWLKLDEGKKEVVIDGKPVKLSRKEYDMLLFLYKHAGNVCSRDDIIAAVWSESKDPSAISDATIDQLIHRLREKVEPEPSNPTRIISKKAFGYMMV